MKKLYDIVAKTGEYQDNQGVTKSSYENAGVMMEKEAGKPFIIMKRTFNPAGVPNPQNRDTVILSCFLPKNKDGTQQQAKQPTQQPNHNQDTTESFTPDELDDEIPF